MADDQSACTGRRRGRGAEAAARAGALERLKAMQRDGRRSEGYVIKVDQPIYDTVPEEEYEELVKKRRHEAQGFIVDDDGLGYGDEGEEEDWSRAGLPPSSSDEEGGGEDREKRKRGERKERDKEGEKKRVNSELSAAAALMGKQRISSMLTSMVFKNRDSSGKVMGADCESILNNVIAEFAPDEGDKERRRRVNKEPAVFGKCSGLNSAKNESRSVIWKSDLGRKEEKLDEVNENVEFGNGNGLVEEVRDDVVKRNERESEVEGQVEKSDVEVKVDPVVKEEGSRPTLNAKVNREVADPALSATREWQAVRNFGSVSNVEVKEDPKSGMSGEELSEFELNPDGSLPFFILDAHEEVFGANMGTVYLFGKVPIKSREVSVQVKSEKTYHSCCAVVKNMQRCVYAIPKSSIFATDEILRLEKDVEESKVSPAEFRKKLQDMADELKNEVASQLVALNVSTFSMTPVKRKYAFDRSDIPRGENYVLKINYPFKDPPLQSDLKGETFFALLGTHSSALELFLIKRKVKGPSWMSVSQFLACPASQRVSWCKFEVIIDSPKEICVSSLSEITPPVAVTAINLKTVTNEKQNVNEIVSASIICCHRAKIDAPMLASECNRSGMRYFTVVRKLDGGIFPMGFSKEATDRNTKAASTVLAIESSERALLNRLMIELHKLDTDVLVGHNISGFDLDVLLHRAQACRVPSSMWSKIGRLKRSMMPKITKGNFLYGSGASPGIMSCIAGRLLCDTYLCSRDLLKEVSYSLTHLAKTRLKKERTEISPHDVPKMFQKSSNLIELIEYGETDAWLSMELMFHLSVLPLTRQLTNISGNLWGKTLQGARAQRVEYLLLHAFHAKKYIVPDKIPSYVKEGKMTKRRMNHGIEDGDAQGIEPDDANLEDQMQHNDSSKAKRSSAYAGGLVLEPKKGLYDRYVLLLDFNSLYPSIIQEYNICFTTVDRSLEGLIPQLPSSKIAGVLPELLKILVEQRRMVKNQMKKTESGLDLQRLDVQQQALKLTANSMYGCLGFSNSRFYAKPLAELITLQGREILQTTVDLVQNNLNLEVIYGDTDSIMIYSGIDNIAKAKSIAVKVIQEVNKKYKCLEIDLDSLYSRMLLLKKKKYAAVKVQSSDGTTYEVIERKGLDMVRRDWSLLSKEVGDYCLSQILSGGSCEDVVESIHNSLMKVQEEMRNGQTALEKYVITKTLTKPPEAYPDAKNQPHVLVAQRLKQNGHTAGCSVGDTVPYIICLEQGASTGSSSGIAQRARHPDELVRDDGKWIIDIDYYLSQQILPVVSRLCASIQGTSPERLADCLGLDSSKYHMKSSGAVTDDPSGSLLFSISDEERYQSCEPLMLSCPSCSSSFRCPAVFSSICMATSEKQSDPPVEESTKDFWRRMHCPKCPEGDAGRISPAMIANQVKRQAEGFISRYYKGLMTCDDETCKHTTRSLNLRLMGDSERGTLCPNYPRCHGRLIRKFTEADLYKQLTYYCYLLDTVRCVEKMDTTARIPLEKELAKVRPIVKLALSMVQEMRNRCAYGWVRLNDLTVTV